jgi:uncharacterized protein (DUF1810 family)
VSDDPFDLQRFVTAQDLVGLENVCAELREGRKRTHWMWFVFPQIAGLGSSARAQKFAISSLDEARAYLRHPILGPRLLDCTRLVNRIEGKPIGAIFGDPDDSKFHSSMTLFAQAGPDCDVFRIALQKYFGGSLDSLTLSRL